MLTSARTRDFWKPLINTRFSPADTARLEAMDLELVVLEEMRLRALQLRNESTAICRLPPEILLDIFTFLRDTWLPQCTYFAPGPGSEQRNLYSSGWMSVTHVCKKWRTVRVLFVHSITLLIGSRWRWKHRVSGQNTQTSWRHLYNICQPFSLVLERVLLILQHPN